MLDDMILLVCEVKKCGALSLILFTVYVNDLIEKLSRSNHRCRIGSCYGMHYVC